MRKIISISCFDFTQHEALSFCRRVSFTVLITVFFCILPNVAISAEDILKIVDMAGRSHEFSKPAQRIVCLGPGSLRLITYLEATDRLVAIESGFEKDSPAGRPYRMAHPELANLPGIGQASPTPAPNAEALVSVRPDVIFISYTEGQAASELEEKTGIPVVVLSCGDLASFDTECVFNSLRIAGIILGKTARAEEVIKFIMLCEKDITDRTANLPDNEKEKVYVAGLGSRGTHGITSTDYSYPPFELLAAKNVAKIPGRRGHVFVDKEKILQWNPDIIFIDGGGFDIIRDDYKKDRKFYNLLSAVRESNLYILLPYNYYTTNIDTALADTYYIGKIIYPEGFKDIEPGKKADEIYTFLVGKPVFEAMKNDWKAFRKAGLDE